MRLYGIIVLYFWVGGYSMALIKCPECGREKVSDSAETCPDCGFGIKTYFQKMKEVEYISLLDPSNYDKIVTNIIPTSINMFFSDGVEDGARGKLNSKNDYEYWVENGHLFTQQRGYNVTEYILDGDCLINLKGTWLGSIPDNNYFNVTCSRPCLYNASLTERITFKEDGTFINQTDGKVGVSGSYIRRGNLIAERSKDTGNKANCFLIYEGQIHIATFVKRGSNLFGEAKLLCDELNKSAYNPQIIGTPVTKKQETSWQRAVRTTNEANGVTCPYCKSTNCSKLGSLSRGLSFGLLGFGSGKIGKQWHCNSCKSDF